MAGRGKSKRCGDISAKRIAVSVLFLLICVSVARAQMPTATILGTVRDSSGAVVPDALLTARNVNTGQVRTTTSAADGSFRFSALPVGSYEMRVAHSGFQTESRSGLTLTVAQEATVNFTLQLGAVEQTVAVTAEAPLVNTTSGSLGGLVNEDKVENLPLNGRNYIDLTLLQPGVTQHREVGANPNSVGLWYSSNGAPVYSNNYLLDGSSMLTLLGANSASTAGATLGLDGIREYRVLTNAFSAEYGMRMGSQVMLVSKSGTNQFHGDVFEYLRNSALDARNFFDYPPAGAAPGYRLPPYKRNQFGGSFGGPIKKDKTFFYAVYEGLRQRLGLTIVDNVMAAGCHGPAGAVITNTACRQLGPTVPSVTIAPVIAPLLALYPLPNLVSTNQFTFPFNSPTRDDYGQMRVDQVLSSNDNLFARYTVDDADVTTAITGSSATGQSGIQSYPGYSMTNDSRSQFGTLTESHVFSSMLLNTARFSFSRTAPRSVSVVPFSGPQYAFIPANSNEMGTISISGIASMGPFGTTPAYLPQNIFSWSDDLFYTRGKHSLKMGALINRFQLYDETARGYQGTATFASVANFLRGVAQSYAGLTPGSNTARNYRFTSLGFYGQDDFRVSQKFTLNLGLRYEFITQLYETHNIQAAFHDIAHDPRPTVGVPFLNPTLRNFSPRFGFAWDVQGNGKTAVRGGFGLLYDIGTYGTTMNVIQPTALPFSSNSTVVSPPVFTVPFTFTPANIANTVSLFDYHLRQQHLLSYNLTVERQLPFSMALSVAYAGSRGINIIGARDGNPTVPQGVPVNGVCVPHPTGQPVNLNAPYCWLGNNLDPYTNPNFPNTITIITTPANSFYNALQVLLTKQFSHGLQFQSSYTWSRLIDDPQAEATNVISSGPVQPTDNTNRHVDRALSVFDIPQNWRFNAIYRLPSSASGFAGALLNGWQMSGILSLQSGYPFTVNLQTNRSLSKAFNSLANLDRPNLVPGRTSGNITSGVSTPNGIDPCLTAGQPLGTPNLWFDPCAFTIQPAGFLGNAGRNILRGPGLANLDFSLVKDTAMKRLGESGRLEFRAEIFNILNHANFDIPARTAYAGTPGLAPVSSAGVITSTAGTTSRQIQFALKVLF